MQQVRVFKNIDGSVLTDSIPVMERCKKNFTELMENILEHREEADVEEEAAKISKDE